ncbi:protein of unknown function [Nitrospira japonica]|uniref:Uncharacterized protein n=1 Tax=Nitrospira japonica TaxID=1325564 RepID=A0A1W1I0N2_9BACT|nr:protein of unknown function [Nitrospira japonica]
MRKQGGYESGTWGSHESLDEVRCAKWLPQMLANAITMLRSNDRVKIIKYIQWLEIQNSRDAERTSEDSGDPIAPEHHSRNERRRRGGHYTNLLITGLSAASSR